MLALSALLITAAFAVADPMLAVRNAMLSVRSSVTDSIPASCQSRCSVVVPLINGCAAGTTSCDAICTTANMNSYTDCIQCMADADGVPLSTFQTALDQLAAQCKTMAATNTAVAAAASAVASTAASAAASATASAAASATASAAASAGASESSSQGSTQSSPQSSSTPAKASSGSLTMPISAGAVAVAVGALIL